MKNLIKKILSEDMDWIEGVAGAPNGITILDPKSKTNPKNKFRVYVTHSHGEEGGTWADNWFNVKQDDTRGLIRLLCFCIVLNENNDRSDLELTRLYIEEGETWVLDNTQGLSDTDLADEDVVFERIREELHDWGLIEYDSYRQDDAYLERYWVTYFDENGIEHKTSLDKKAIWGQRNS
jgi:hypothetical protein